MIVKTAYDANVLLENADGELKARPITFHVPTTINVSRAQMRARLLRAVEDHYQTQGRVVSLMVSEQVEIGKQIVSIRRDPNGEHGELQVNPAPRIEPSFRLGGEIITIEAESPALH